MRGSVSAWGAVPLELVKDVRLTRQDIAVYVAMSYRRGNNETMWASMTTIAEDCGIKRNNVHRHISKLRSCGWIAAIDKKGAGRHYAVLMPFEPTTTQTGVIKADAPTDVKYIKADAPPRIKADAPTASRLMHKENKKTTTEENRGTAAPSQAPLGGQDELAELRRLYGANT